MKYVMNCHKVHATGGWLNAGDEGRGVQAMNLSGVILAAIIHQLIAVSFLPSSHITLASLVR